MPVYLDYNATTPLDDQVKTSISEALEHYWQNPSSSYASGRVVHQLIEKSREDVASCIGCRPCEIIFTSGGTESNGLVFHSCLSEVEVNRNSTNQPNDLPHVICSTIEHDSVLLPLERLHQQGQITLSRLPVEPASGTISLSLLANTITHNTVLVSVMLANNETGAIADVAGVVRACRAASTAMGLSRPIWVHTDAAQALGKMPVSVKELGVDYLTLVGHKFYGPRIGALYVRNLRASMPSGPDGDGLDLFSPPCKAMLLGGGQERNFRSGTENTPMIVGLGTAARLVRENVVRWERHLRSTREYLVQTLKEAFGKENVAFLHEFPQGCSLSNVCSVAFLNQPLTGVQILQRCPEVEASVGAACHSGKESSGNYLGSAVLRASGVSPEVAARAVRLSLGKDTSLEQVRTVVDCLKTAMQIQ